MILASGGLPAPGLAFATLVGGALGAAGASAINNYLDRDLDRLMDRTASRPLASGALSPRAALGFGFLLLAGSFIVLAVGANLLAATLTLGAALFYLLVYTRWLKRSSVHNIVIGGAAGAVPPLVGWAAVAGQLGLLPLLLFAIIFFWTPPHFWALSLVLKDEYQRAHLPMLPVVRGEEETRRQILVYTVTVTALSLLTGLAGHFGPLYFGAALTLGIGFLYLALRLFGRGSRADARRLFRYSIVYLGLLFLMMVIDHLA